MDNDIMSSDTTEEDISLLCEIIERFLYLSPEDREKALEELYRLTEQ